MKNNVYVVVTTVFNTPQKSACIVHAKTQSEAIQIVLDNEKHGAFTTIEVIDNRGDLPIYGDEYKETPPGCMF